MEDFDQAAFERATNVSRETLERLAAYVALLHEWKDRVNLISDHSFPTVWHRHVYDSAQIFTHLPDLAGPLIDLGSGAGFPGMVLAIMGAGDVHLVESDGRKCAFLSEVAQATGAAVTIHNDRAEQMKPFPAATVTSRAMAPLTKLLSYVAPFMGKKSVALLNKGKSWQEELTAAAGGWKMAVDSIPSISDPSGVILRIKDLRRVSTSR